LEVGNWKLSLVNRDLNPLVSRVATIQFDLEIVIRHGRPPIVDGQRATNRSALRLSKSHRHLVTDVTKTTTSITNHCTINSASEQGGIGPWSIRVRKDMEMSKRKIAEQPFCLREVRVGLARKSDDQIGTD